MTFYSCKLAITNMSTMRNFETEFDKYVINIFTNVSNKNKL